MTITYHNYDSNSLKAASENGDTTRVLKSNAEGHLQVAIKEPLSGFGELLTTQLTARVQIDAVYGLLSSDTETFTATGGSTTASNSMFVCQSGTSVGGYGVIRSRRHITSRPGQSVRCRFNAKFTAGVASSLQFGGLFTSTNGFFVGYNGADFGVWRRLPGATEIQRLTITNGTGGNETHTITMNSIVYTVNTTGVLTSARLSEEIAENIVAAVWASSTSPKSNDSTITFIQNTPAVANGTYTYSSTGTGAGTFARIQTGVANDDTTYFVRQSKFNYDILDGSKTSLNPTGETLDPTKLNVYEVIIPYLGAGSIRFSRMDSEGHFEIMTILEYTNSFTVPSQTNPSYKLGWGSASLGSTTNLTVAGASAAAFIEGMISSLRYPFAFSTSLAAGATEYVIFAIRSRGEFSNTINQRQPQLLNISGSLDASNRIATISIYINPTLTGATNWTYVNQSLSCIEYATPTTLTPSGGILIQSFTVTASPQIVNLESLQTRITPGDVIAVGVKTLSGAVNCVTSINWLE